MVTDATCRCMRAHWHVAPPIEATLRHGVQAHVPARRAHSAQHAHASFPALLSAFHVLSGRHVPDGAHGPASSRKPLPRRQAMPPVYATRCRHTVPQELALRRRKIPEEEFTVGQQGIK